MQLLFFFSFFSFNTETETIHTHAQKKKKVTTGRDALLLSQVGLSLGILVDVLPKLGIHEIGPLCGAIVSFEILAEAQKDGADGHVENSHEAARRSVREDDDHLGDNNNKQRNISPPRPRQERVGRNVPAWELANRWAGLSSTQ